MNGLKQWALSALIGRLLEPSTWAGGGMGFWFIQTYIPAGPSGELRHDVLRAVSAACAAMAIIVREKNATKKEGE